MSSLISIRFDIQTFLDQFSSQRFLNLHEADSLVSKRSFFQPTVCVQSFDVSIALMLLLIILFEIKASFHSLTVQKQNIKHSPILIHFLRTIFQITLMFY